MIHHTRLIEIALVVIALFVMWYAVVNFSTFKRVVIGRPMRSRELNEKHNKLFWMIALPILSADLYSSVAYGPEAGLTELAHLGRSALWIVLPITGASVILLFILILSYIMGIIAYPSGGGAYSIAKDNFKKPWASLVASSSLLVDYVLTVAVSVSAGIQAVASAYPVIKPYSSSLAICCVLLLVIVNLRGVAESATIFAWPTFVFMACMILIICTGFIDELSHGFVQPSTPTFGEIPGGITILLILKAFSSACSALTGIETISNAVPVFREPRQRSAIKTYIALGSVTAVTLIGYAYHLYVRGVEVREDKTMLSQLAEQYFGHGIVYQIIIWSTFIVLILAANSTFTGFSQLSAIVASDSFLPRAFTNRGDRLGYSNGIMFLAGAAALLIALFQAQTNSLIPLYAIGVFLSFTIAQVGLCKRWLKVKGRMWKLKLAINLFGFIVTAVVTVVVAFTKFLEGAWIVLVILPIMISFSVMVKRHYDIIAEELRIDPKETRPHPHELVTLVLVSGVHRAVLQTVSFAQSLDSRAVAIYVGFDDESVDKMKLKWEEWGEPCKLVTLRGEFRSILAPLSRYIDRLEITECEQSNIHIIMPQFVTKKWWHNLLHNQSALLIRAWFLRNKDVVITTVPYHLQK
nr:APC family permease [Paenibacillus albus]